MKKYFFFDFDGTLTGKETGVIPENTKKTIESLKKRGHFLCVATGRLQCDAQMAIKELKISHLISDGGRSLTIDEKILYMYPLNMKDSKRLLMDISSREIPWGISKENSLKIYINKPYHEKFRAPEQFKIVYDENLNINEIENIYKIFLIMTKEEIDNTDFLSLKHVGYRGDITLIEPMEKKNGIEKLKEIYNIPDKDIIVFGDGYNDLTLFDKKWTSIAMGNSPDILKEKADFITKNSWDDGITFACKKFGWLYE